MPSLQRPSHLITFRGFLIFLLLCLSAAGYCAYLVDKPITLTQPDGTTLNYLVSGDEYYNWIHDREGYVIVQDPVSGEWVYAVMVDGQVTSSRYVAGTVDPALVGLTPNIRPSAVKLEAARKTMFALPMDIAPQPAPTSGSINNIVIFIRFSNDSEFTDTVSSYDTVFNNTTAGASSMKNYFTEASYNTLTVSTTFYPIAGGSTVVSYQDSHPRGYYLPYNAATNTIGYTSDNDGGTREQQMLANAVNAVKSQIPSGLNLDMDNDGYVDNICFVAKGGTSDWGTVLWPHMWVLYMQTVNINGKRVWGYNLQFSSWVLPNGVGVLCHEMMHSIGCPDLYHYSGEYADPVGAWDVMCSTGNPPQHPGAYMKYKYLHWISSLPQITTPGTYTLNPLTSSTGACYKIASPNSSTEFFVVEYRRKTGTFENAVPGSGLVVCRINTTTSGNADGPPDEIWVYRPNGTSTSTGDIDHAYFSSTSGRTAINDTTNPASTLSNGQPGGLNIAGIGSAGSTIQFTYGTMLLPPTISPAGGTFTSAKTVTLTSPNGTGEMHYTFNGVDPTSTSPFVASGGTVVVNATSTLKVRSILTGYTSSDVVSAAFKIVNMGVPSIKKAANGTEVGIDIAPVTAAFPDEFYVESSGRNCGILVKKTGHTLTVGMAASVVGTIETDPATNERYINATSAVQNGNVSVKPLATNIKSMGGGAFGPQVGVSGWIAATDPSGKPYRLWGKVGGLNNIGLLVRLAGSVRYIDSSTFGLDDGSPSELLCVAPSGMIVDPNWDHISVTGVSSCYISGSDTLPRLRLKDPPDLILPTGAMISGAVRGLYSLLLQSAHPYAPNLDYTWTITGPADATRMRVHFAMVQTETGNDKLYVEDGANTIIDTYSSSTSITNFWSSWVNGNVIKLRLITNSSVQNYGFRMDKYQADAQGGGMSGVTVTLTPGGKTMTTGADGLYFFRGLDAGTYTVKPTLAGTTFSPTSSTATVVFGQYAGGLNFTAN